MKDIYIQSDLLSESGAINAVSLRVEGKPADFSMRRNGTPEGVEAGNRREFYAALGFDESSVVRGEQVHGDSISVVESTAHFPGTDGLLSRKRNLLLTVSVADCVPVLIFDRERRIAAAVHSGWKGTVKNIAGKTTSFLRRELNSNPRDVVVFIGPAAGVCCYEVGDEVARHFGEQHKRRSVVQGKSMLDLRSAILSQLVESGIPEHNIEVSEYCTICNLNFHSYRRDGESSGRMLAAIAIK